MKEEIIQILNVTRQELVDIIKEGVKLELNRQRSIGNPLNRLSITGEDTEYLTRNEVSKVLNVTVQTLNNWRREGVLNPLKIGGRVLYRKKMCIMINDWLCDLLIKFSFLKKSTSLPSLVNHLLKYRGGKFSFFFFFIFC